MTRVVSRILLVMLAFSIVGCAGARFDSAMESGDPGQLLQYQKDYPAKPDDMKQQWRIEEAKRVRNMLLWQRAERNGPAAIRAYLKDRTNPLRQADQASGPHDQQLLEKAMKANGWEALERYTDLCLRCDDERKAIRMACERRVEALAPGPGEARTLFVSGEANEIVGRCQNVNPAANFVALAQTVMRDTTDHLGDREARLFLGWMSELTTPYANAAREILSGHLARFIRPSLLSEPVLASRKGGLQTTVKLGCTLDVSQMAGVALSKNFSSQAVQCGPRGGEFMVCMKSCNLDVADATLSLALESLPFVVKPKKMNKQGEQEFVLTLNKSSIATLNKPFENTTRYSNGGQDLTTANIDITGWNQTLAFGSYILDPRDVQMSLSNWSSERASIAFPASWDKPKTPLKLIEKGLVSVVKVYNQRYADEVGQSSAEDVDSSAFLQLPVVREYETMTTNFCDLKSSGLAAPCKKAQQTYRKIQKAAEALKREEERIAAEQAREQKRLEKQRERERSQWQAWAERFAWNAVSKEGATNLVSGPVLLEKGYDTDFFFILRVMGYNAFGMPISNDFMVAIRVIPGDSSSYKTCLLGGIVSNPGRYENQTELEMGLTFFRQSFCD